MEDGCLLKVQVSEETRGRDAVNSGVELRNGEPPQFRAVKIKDEGVNLLTSTWSAVKNGIGL